jgi:hypothetical protein
VVPNGNYKYHCLVSEESDSECEGLDTSDDEADSKTPGHVSPWDLDDFVDKFLSKADGKSDAASASYTMKHLTDIMQLQNQADMSQ